MSILFAYRLPDGIAYVGHQSSFQFSNHPLALSDYAIAKMNEEITVAATINGSCFEILTSHHEWFRHDPLKPIDGRFIVQSIVNPFYKELDKLKLIKDSQMDTAFFVVWKNSIYLILKSFAVIEAHDFASLGAADQVLFPYLHDGPMLEDAEKFVLRIAKLSSKALCANKGNVFLYRVWNDTFQFDKEDDR